MTTSGNALAALTIEIVGGGANQYPIALVPFANEATQPQQITKVVAADLQRSGLFRMIDASSVQPQPHEPGEVRWPDWTSRGAEALVIGAVVPTGDGKLKIQFRLLDPVKQAQLAGFSYTITPAQLRQTAHRIADVIYEKLTGDVGVFSTRIAYVTKRGKASYELQVADADGENAQTVLASKEPIISPAWAPDGDRLAYVSFEAQKPVVYVQSLSTGKRALVANFKGNNSAPAWSPDGSQLAVVLTRDNHAQLYLINADGSGLKRLSFSSAIDTEPTFSPDGKTILFTSDRGGSPQIYRMPAAGGDPQRVTFEGGYNVSPHYSPDGNSFVFMQRQGGRFNIAVQDLASGQVQVLTDGALDESPTFAPNGRMILYATETGGRGILAAVSSDGRVKQRLSSSSSDVRDPAWGPLPKNR